MTTFLGVPCVSSGFRVNQATAYLRNGALRDSMNAPN